MKMKKLKLFAATLMLLSFSAAFADDLEASGVAADGKSNFYVKLSNLSESAFGDDSTEYILAPSDFPKGIYVRVTVMSGFFHLRTLDKVKAGFEEKLRKLGFTITKKREDSSVAMPFGSNSLNLAEIEDGENNNFRRSLSVIDDIAGAVLSHKYMGSINTAENGLKINLKMHRKEVDLNFWVMTPGEDNKRLYGTHLHGFADYSEDTPVVNAAIVSMLFDEWAKKHVKTVPVAITETPAMDSSNPSNPASSVPAVSAVPQATVSSPVSEVVPVPGVPVAK
jgi:hypothetical protein